MRTLPQGQRGGAACHTGRFSFFFRPGGKAQGGGGKGLVPLRPEGKAAAKGDFENAVDQAKLQTCRDKLSVAFAELETRGDCLTSGDAPTVESAIDAFVDVTSSALACPCQ